MSTSGSPPTPTTTCLELQTLGGASLMRISATGERTILFGPSKPLALIAFLVSTPGSTATREFVLDLLWADLDPEPARHAFRQTLWYIKRKTGEQLVQATGPAISLGAPICCDRAQFLAAAEKREFERAVALYAGDFLPEFASPGGIEFEHWADLERHHLRDTFVRAAEVVVRDQLSTSRHRDAIALARRARAADRLNESTWRLLLEALVSARDSMGAAIEADALKQMLAAEERDPEPATRAMLRAVHQSSEEQAKVDVRPGFVAELVGREAEFSALLAAWDEARSGTARHVHVSGVAGIGKTRLLADIVARLRARRSRVVWTRANPGERQIAYSLLSQVAAALAKLPGAAAVSPAVAQSLVALDPTLSASFRVTPDQAQGAEALRRRAIAVHDLLLSVAEEAPIAVVVDDLHWADDASRNALASVAQRLDGQRVLLVTAARPAMDEPMALSRTGTQLRLAPLDASDVGALLASVGSLPDSALSDRLPRLLVEATGGSPLLILETLQLLLEQQILALEGGALTIAREAELLSALTWGGALKRRIEALSELDRSVLATMAVAGVPVTATFIANAAERAEPAVFGVLRDLEQRGLATHLSGAWEPAHDQIAELALAGMDSSADREVELSVGRAWMLDGTTPEQGLRRAGVHFARAGHTPEMARAFSAWVAVTRKGGDKRPAGSLADDFLGEQADKSATISLVRALPLGLRFRVAHWQAAAALILVAIASAAATKHWMARPVDAPDASLIAIASDSLGKQTQYVVDLRRDNWLPDEDIVLRGREQRVSGNLPASLLDADLSPDGKAWASSRTMPDSGGIEVVLDPRNGREVRLTTAKGDDGSPSWSPDGAEIAFASGRFDALSHSHIAVLDLTTHTVRQLTRGSGRETSPRWSPTGLRIAFTRISYDDDPDAVCTIAPDGSREACRNDMGTVPTVLGWVDSRRVVVHVHGKTIETLLLVDVDSGSVHRVEQRTRAIYKLSPDGQWVACVCRDARGGGVHTIVFPIDQPDRVREVVEDPLAEHLIEILWTTPRRTAQFVASVAIDAPASGIPLGVTHRLRATGITLGKARVALSAVRWRSSDYTVARIDDSGILLPVRPGHVRLVASAGGWRTAVMDVEVVAPYSNSALHESWSTSVEDHFVPFGDPRPLIVPESVVGHAFWNNGDGSNFSGAYSAAAFDSREGVGVEVRASTPLGLGQWQVMNVELVPDIDSTAFAEWDRVTGWPPISSLAQSYTCSFGYPGDEGRRTIRAMLIAGEPRAFTTKTDLRLSSGRWYTVRLQILPDGRCGVAFDGMPVAIVDKGAPLGTKYRLFLDGQSVKTRILIGPVDVWYGVRSGVDWVGFDTTRVGRGGGRPAPRHDR